MIQHKKDKDGRRYLIGTEREIMIYFWEQATPRVMNKLPAGIIVYGTP